MQNPTSNLQLLTSDKGQAALVGIISLILISLVVADGFTSLGVRQEYSSRNFLDSLRTYAAAESGIEDGLYRIKSGKNVPSSFNFSVGSSTAQVNISSVSSSQKEITSSGALSQSTRNLKASVTTGTGTDFRYGVQVGDGGITMGNGAKVVGNVFSNGSIIGGVVTGDATVAGGINNNPSVEWITEDVDQFFATTSASQDIAQSFVANNTGKANRVGVYLAKVGVPTADITLRLTADNGGKPSTVSLASVIIPRATVGATPSWITASFSSAPTVTNGVKYWIVLDYSVNSPINHWAWRKDSVNGYVGNTGRYANNWSSGTAAWVDTGGDLAFEVWIGGVNTKIDSVTIGDATSGSGHANLFVGSTIHGSSCPNQYCVVENPAREELPLSDGLIQDWRDEATAGGVCAPPVCDSSGNFNLTNNAVATTGPIKIPGDLTISNGARLNLSGTVYVEGNITLSNNCVIRLVQDYGPSSAVFLTDGNAVVSNNCIFSGSGTAGSYIMLLSAKNATTSTVMTISNNSSGVIYYAGKGKINFSNNATAKEATAYGIDLSNNAVITYETGLANLNFSSGPSGGWNINSWRETE